MQEFFQSQFDYIYFFYGLMFIFLAFICYLMNKEEKKGLSWSLLGWFGLLHGLHEWLELLILIVGYNYWVDLFRIFLLTSSFVFLFEFARRCFSFTRKRSSALVLYTIFILLLFLGWYIDGLMGMQFFIRYYLAFFGAIGAGFGICLSFKKLRYNSTILFLAPASFILYGLSQLITPFHLLGFNYILDPVSFFNYFKFPIQLVRALEASLISLSIWYYYQFLVSKTINKQIIFYQKIRWQMLALAVLLILSVGWLATNFLGKIAKIDLQSESGEITTSLIAYVNNIIVKGSDMSKITAQSPGIINFVDQPTPENLIVANEIVDRYKQTSGSSIFYVMDRNGKVIVTSNRNGTDSLLNNYYSFRPYFTEAISGRNHTMFALGVTTKKSGFYASTPIKNKNNQIVAVAVVKMDMAYLQDELSRYNPSFLISPDGVVLFSGLPQYNLRTLYPLSAEQKEKIRLSREFGDSDLVTLLKSQPTDGDIVEIDHLKYLFTSKPVAVSGWKIAFLHPVDLIYLYRLFGMILTLIVCFITLASTLIIQIVKRNLASSFFALEVASSDDAIISRDMDEKIFSWNSGAEKIYGYKANEIIGKSIFSIIPKDKTQEYKDLISSVLAGKQVKQFETKRMRKDGQLIVVSLTTSLIKNESGEIIGISTVGRDITKQKLMELKIKDQMLELEKFKLTIENASDSIVFTDADGYILYANQASERISGFSRKEMYKKKISQLWGGKMDKKYYEKLWDTIKNKKEFFEGEIKNHRKSGEEYVVNAKIYPILDANSGIQYFVGVEVDITKIKQIDKMKSEFVSITSHQLRTPLTGIKWFSELLLKNRAGVLTANQKDYVSQIAESNNRMIKLVDDLLDVSHIETTGKYLFDFQSGDISEIIKKCVADQLNIANNKNLKINLNLSCKSRQIIKMDKEKIRQVIQNLLSNAIKYSKRGGVIKINCKKEEKAIIFAIKDTGVGIPLHQQNRVFEKFFRADNVISTESGTGLGLYIAKFIIENHQGKIWFESKSDKGSTFYFSLPIK